MNFITTNNDATAALRHWRQLRDHAHDNIIIDTWSSFNIEK